MSLAALAILAGAMSVVAATPPATSTAGGETRASPDDGPRALPTDLNPPLAIARDFRPGAYADGCHARAGDRRARPCALGPQDATFSVVLIGDSHALQWLPAMEAIARREGWRLYSLTKSACPVPATTVIVHGRRMRDCDAWRASAFERIGELHPDLVVAASLGRIYRLRRGGTPERRAGRWEDAWVDSLTTLRAHAGRVVLLGDTPMWQRDPIECLRAHADDIGRCDTPRDVAISARTEATERAAAARAGVTYVPTADLVCMRDPCRAVEGRSLVLVDTQHMTVTWAQAVALSLQGRLTCGVRMGAPSPAPSARVSQGTLGPSPVDLGATPTAPLSSPSTDTRDGCVR